MDGKADRTLTAGNAALGVATLATLFALTWSDWYWRLDWNPSVAYPTLLLTCWWVRSQRFVWLLTVLAIISSLGIFTAELGTGVYEGLPFRPIVPFLQRLLGVTAILVTGGVFHWLIGSWEVLHATSAQIDAQRTELQTTNDALSAREHEIATQNEELRSQTEEMERQGEELRVANEELARRERSLESLLRLSRSLNAEMTRSDTLDRICQALSEMVASPNLGVGVKLKEGNVMRLACHYGFGPGGPISLAVPYDASFAKLVLDRNHTGYLEDIALRPDVQIPQPREGERFRSILAAPLRVNGHAVGTLEVYSRERRTWSDEQIGMVESLASQTSVSLQAAELFDRVDRERRRFETIFRTLPLGVSVLDTTTGRVANNPEAVLMLGMPPDSDVGQRREHTKYRVFRDGVEMSADKMPMFRAAEGEEVHGEEVELVFPGRRMILLTAAAPIRAADGSIDGSVVAFTDITALKHLQAELDSRRREAEEASVRKSRFLAQVSHDIRNPANTISLLAELLYRTASQSDGNSEVASIASDLRRNSLSLVDLVSDVLDLTRFDSGRIELEETEFSLNEMILEECRGYREMAAEKKLDFECKAPSHPITIRADRVKLSRVLGNLLGNALKFTEKGGIEIKADSVPNDGQLPQVEICICDSGPGINPEYHDRIFDEFFQLRSSNGNRGAGLGLAICKRLIEAMGGSIRVNSTPGKGSTFAVRLPSSAIVRR